MPLKGDVPAASTGRRDITYKDGYVAQDGTVVQYHQDWTKQHQLEGDGLLSGLYNYMWKSDKTKEHRLKTAWIPDTVLFLHNFPRVWYAYDQKSQEIYKRPGRLLDARNIYEFFARGQGSDIVAQFFHQKSGAMASAGSTGVHGTSTAAADQDSPQASPRGYGIGAGRVNHDDEDEPACDVEFFTRETLYDFLHNRKSKPDGVLQKFVLPKGDPSSKSNFQIQAVWSPVVTLVYKRTNKYRLNDRSLPVHERAATFDGPPHYSTESLVADSTRKRVHALCTAIVKHFKDTEHKPITRLVLYFKTDERDRMWVLWASSIRIARDRANHSHLRVPLHLSMKVNSGEQDDETPRGRNQRQRDLLERDIALYELTGDWIFAAKCAGRGRDQSPPGQIQVRRPSQSSSRPSTAPRVPKPPPLSSPLRDQVAREREQNNNNSSTNNKTDESSTVPAIAPRPPVYLSPRAPFLATTARHQTTDINSDKHPLHSVYVELHTNAAATAGDGNEGSRRTFTQRRHEQRSRDHLMPKELSEREKLRKELQDAAEDAVYLAYSGTLQMTPTRYINSKGVEVQLAASIRAALSSEEINQLVQVMCLEPTEANDGFTFTTASSAVTRGRRVDRPVAQILKDVEYFLEDLFESSEQAIMIRWQEYLDSQSTVMGD